MVSAFHHNYSIEIDAPLQSVYDYVCNPNSWPEWISASHKIKSLNRPLFTDETFTEERRTEHGIGELKYRVVDCDRPYLWRIETEAIFTGEVVVKYDLYETMNGCIFSRTVVTPERPKPLMGRAASEMDEKARVSLQNIRRNVENRYNGDIYKC